MLFPPLDLLGKNEGLKVLTKFDVRRRVAESTLQPPM